MNRPVVRSESLVLLIAGYLVLFANQTWWTGVLAGRSFAEVGNWWFALALGIALSAVHYVLFGLVAIGWFGRVVLSIAVIAAMAINYYMRTYGVVIDPTMMQNVLATDAREASEFISRQSVLSIVLPAVPPLFFIWWVRFRSLPWGRALAWRLLSMLIALVLAAACVFSVYRDFSSLMRNERGLRYRVTPANIIYGTLHNLWGPAGKPDGPRSIVAADARFVGSELERPRVLVIVVGETARAANFSLLGYSRDTNPQLLARNVVAFRDVTACGTSTEVSLPCMFSAVDRRDYDEDRIRTSEGLLDVLVRAGYRVFWRDNQSGCKGVCANPAIDSRTLRAKDNPQLCSADGCNDGVLAGALADILHEPSARVAIVLHMLGQHGPAYYQRYPRAYRVFTPTCDTAELRRCTREQVVNSYDNALRYTDAVLASIIDLLAAQQSRIDSAMLFVSDHGESLGESGLYLHGMPYAIAPDVQLQVPMVFWATSGFMQLTRLDENCLRQRAQQPAAHDNLFHSVLGILDVTTTAYDRSLDVLASCRNSADP
ncbi:MAG: phosphoethanolamine--lipid A transferase [Steroidobacteraceae bacterium]